MLPEEYPEALKLLYLTGKGWKREQDGSWWRPTLVGGPLGRTASCNIDYAIRAQLLIEALTAHCGEGTDNV